MRALILAIALGAPASVHAQQMDHDQMHHEQGEPVQQAQPPDTAPQHEDHSIPAPEATPDHAVPAKPARVDEHAGHLAPEPFVQPAAGPPPEALSGPAHAADLTFDPIEMARARRALTGSHGAIQTHKIMIDELEWRSHDGVDAYAWEGQGWFGGDINRFWFRTEGEGEFGGRLDMAEVQALWSRAIDPWFNVELGVRHDFRQGADRTYLVAGVHGLAPYWLEVSAAAFVSDKGEIMARLEGDHDLRLTGRLILQPRIKLDLAAQDVPELRIGSGLSTAELGLRLRYQIEPEIAPYIGVNYERSFGRTSTYRRARGEETGNLSVVAGMRFWF